jgi:hypothetical protein
MLHRCNTARGAIGRNYRERGISVCERWSKYENFLADMGERPTGMTLERENVNGNYEPDNCIWATMKTQQNNRRNNRRIAHDGQDLTVAQWAELRGWSRHLIYGRLRNGWGEIDAITRQPGQ